MPPAPDSRALPAPDETRRGLEVESHPSKWRMGDWLIDADTHRISGPEGTTRVEPKVMHVLRCLAEQPGQTVSIDRLLHTVWGDTVVEENALRRAISHLRKAFDDDPRQPRFIETIPKKGYRLIAPVTPSYLGDAAPPAVADISLAPSGYRPVSPATASPLRNRWFWAILGLVLAGLVWVVVGMLESPSPMRPLAKVPLTSFRGLETSPVLSPDGSRVAFVWWGEHGNDRKVYVKLVEADSPRRLTDSPGQESSPAWSPDGHRIAYFRYTSDACGVYVAPVTGSGEHKLADCPPYTGGMLAWSPDGKWMALPARIAQEEPQRIFLISTDTAEQHPLTDPAPGFDDSDPMFSPGSDRVSFIRYARGQEDLFVVPTTGGEPSRILTAWGDIADHDWTPNGKHLVFSSNKGGNYRLWKVAASGGTPEWLAAVAPYDPSTPTFARTGNRMAYVEWFFDFNIWRIATTAPSGDAPVPTRWISSSQWDQHPRYAPDGRHIAFTSNRSGSNELWVADADGSRPSRLTSFGSAFVSTPRWSPDGRHIVFEARLEAQADLYVIDARGGIPRQLTTHPFDDIAPHFSHDGAWIYFGSRRSGAWQIWKIPASGGEALQVTEEGGIVAAASSDGRTLYYSKATSPGLWRRPVEGGGEELVLPALAVVDRGNWALHTHGIYFVKRDPGGPVLAYYDFTTENTTPLTDTGAPLSMNEAGLSLSPDGAYLLFTRTDQRESDIVLVEDFR
ncbi:MAG: winged helix-turn-helix domain-containing protein [Rhodothermales bacterium]